MVWGRLRFLLSEERVPTPSPSKLLRGQIIWFQAPDEAGRNDKGRPVVLVTSEDEVPLGSPLVGVAVTSTLPVPLTPMFVPLPWHRSGHPRTGLWVKCAAKCDWLIAVPRDPVPRILGRVPDHEFAEILRRVQALPPATP
jgi:mRNA-degrading endonuclease toxin of MazEF toxin-antitoxin module